MTLLTPELLDTKTYGFEKLRYLLQSVGIQEGVVDAADLKVVQRALGANMSVDVGAGRCFIQGDSGTRNGLYHEVNDAMINVAVTAANATNPRIDQVILEIHDSSDLGSADDIPQLYVLAGTATAGATLDNRTGAAALPNNAIRLADILVPAASSSVVTANIRDRRQWARGAFRQILRTGLPDYTTTSGTPVAIDATNLAPRVECSGAPISVRLGAVALHSAANSRLSLSMLIDSVVAPAGANDAVVITAGAASENNNATALVYEGAPTAGSHVLAPAFRVIEAGTAFLRASAATPLRLTIEEIVRQNADNT